MSINAEHQSTTQPSATTSDSKGKSEEVNLSVHEDMSDSGESRKSTDLSPVYMSHKRKRPLEVEEEDETNNSEDPPRKKFAGNPRSLPKPRYNRVRNSEGEPDSELRYVALRLDIERYLDVDDQFGLYH
ncbi:hypothetical protein EDD22DRAFT_1047172 [Suillus occidentalis]|nr:hypothetical protein EDD22DRAFT_1047172 [Suillus occidentalis]